MTAPVYIIAEAGVNHNGSLEVALRLVDMAADAGADAVKFQSFTAESLVSRGADKANYQKRSGGAAESQYDMLKRLELDQEAHLALIGRCRERGIDFLSTPFDLQSADLLGRTLNLPLLKVASGEITNAPLLLALARTGKPLVLSTGMSTLGEVEDALSVIAYGYLQPNYPPAERSFREAYRSSVGQDLLLERVTLLHCTTEYPAPFQEVNLRAMGTLQDAFGLPVGLSDHTPGIAVSVAAVALGATLIEKHVTLDCNMEGPDHRASLEPQVFAELVSSIRAVEMALGTRKKLPTASEVGNLQVARKSLVARRPILKGEPFTAENLTAKRPGSGVSPKQYWEFLGKRAVRDFSQDEPVSL